MNISGILLKRSQRLRKPHICGRLLSSAAPQSVEKIEIPTRIPRGPTDILRALEGTISRDPTAAHYKYHDDPYLLPMNNLAKRSYSMAQEAGRKAAHWVRSENPELFNHQECDPPIEAFFPKLVYTENSEVTEEDLKNVIARNEVSDALLVKSLLNAKDVEISDETKQSLLELLCFNNSEDPLNEELIEERWYAQSAGTKKQKKTWKDGGAAEEIFISFDDPSAEAYSAIIQGMAKYYQTARAYHLFEEAQTKGLVLDINAYNAIIRSANFIKEGYDLRWAFVVNLLETIRQAQLKPNLDTLNSILYTLSTMGNSKNVRDFLLKTLIEFKSLGIEPSLGSWYYVLITFCKDRGPKSGILSSILKQIENKEYHIQDIRDTHFFVTAMDVANYHLNDVSLGERVHKLLLTGKNYDLIGDSYKESIYYRHYTRLLLANIPFEEFMEKAYNCLVPNIYVPEPTVMKEIIQQIDVNGAIEHIPKIWSDLIIFNLHNREDLLNLILSVMTENTVANESELVQKFADIAWDIYGTVDNQNEERFNTVKFTGNMLGKIMTLVLKNDDFEKGCIVMDKLDSQHQTIVGVPSFDSLSLFVDQCIKNKAPSLAICFVLRSSNFLVDSSISCKTNTLTEENLAAELDVLAWFYNWVHVRVLEKPLVVI